MILIDGYNLLHATDIFGRDALAGTLQGSREALLEFLAKHLTAKERKQTTIVFDAAGAPPGLPDRTTHNSIRVRYARNYPDADALLEEIIAKARGPKGLLVVSSDHRVQRAARSRGARYTDSAPWHTELSQRAASSAPPVGKPMDTDIGAADYWAEQFDDPDLEKEIQRSTQPPVRPGQPPPSLPAVEAPESFGEGIFDPFPPGYVDEIVREIENEDDDPKI